MEKFLSVTGFGPVHEGHFERGYILASEYFQSRDLDFLECYKAYELDKNSKLGKHWIDAERKANLVLYASNIQDYAMLDLEIVDEDYYG